MHATAGKRGSQNFASTGFSEVALRVALTVGALATVWASLRTVAEPKPPAPPVTGAEALVRSIRAPNRNELRRGRRSEPGGEGKEYRSGRAAYHQNEIPIG